VHLSTTHTHRRCRRHQVWMHLHKHTHPCKPRRQPSSSFFSSFQSTSPGELIHLEDIPVSSGMSDHQQRSFRSQQWGQLVAPQPPPPPDAPGHPLTAFLLPLPLLFVSSSPPPGELTRLRGAQAYQITSRGAPGNQRRGQVVVCRPPQGCTGVLSILTAITQQ
jgi:hypothetical protein